MKKLFALCLCFLFIGIVNAEKCTVVTGDGSHIGDEIKCGTEYFYIINTNNNQTKLLAKYNLYAGDKIDAITVEENEWPANYNEEYEFCENLAREKGYNPYLVFPRQDKFLCRVYEKLTPEHIRQDPKAEGTKVANDDSVLPIYGIGYMNPNWGYGPTVNDEYYENRYDNNGDLIINGSSFGEYINGYKAELESQKIEVVSVGMPVINTMKQFFEDISGKEFVSNLEEDPNYENPYAPYFYTLKMDIKEYVPEKFSWVYDRAYWLGSGFPGNSDAFDYYISNEGLLCLMGRGICKYFAYPIGNGIRPLVTIQTKNINYIIETKTDGNGEVTAEKVQAQGGEVIKFTVKPNEGYVLGSVKVTDSTGKVVVFKDYTFTMPNANVLIEATFVKVNPKTADVIITTATLLFILSFIVIMIQKKRIDKIKEAK